MQESSCGRIMDDDGYAPSIFPESEHACFYANDRYSSCGTGDIHRHIIFYSTKDNGLREISKAHGAWLNLCPVHSGYVKFFPQMKRALEREAQQRMMELCGWDEKQFLHVFGKDYLAVEEPGEQDEEG